MDVLLVTHLPQNLTYTLKKNYDLIIDSESGLNHTRYSFNVSTGIFTIKDIDKTDDDTYSIEIFNNNGAVIVNTKFTVSIQGE